MKFIVRFKFEKSVNNFNVEFIENWVMRDKQKESGSTILFSQQNRNPLLHE